MTINTDGTSFIPIIILYTDYNVYIDWKLESFYQDNVSRQS